MLRLIQTIKNIWKIEDLRIRVLFTLGFILIYRLGSYVVLPGVNPDELDRYQQQAQEGILGIINMFAGGAWSRASIFGLGIMPYISASIVIQLLTIAVPYFQRLQKEGESGRKKMNQITRVLTIAVTATQSVAFLANLRNTAPSAVLVPDMMSSTMFMFCNIVILTAGTMFVMWLGEKITDKGLGNGISLLIMIGIVARLPLALIAEFDTRLGDAGGGLVVFFVEIVALLFVILGAVLLVQGTRRIPVQYAKRIVGNKQYGGVRQYLPLKINAAGVMPIIFAQALMFIPATVAQFFPESAGWRGLAGAFNNYASFPYNFTYALLIVLFTYFYTAVTINPVQIADDLKRNGGFIPGIKPGKKTSEYIDSIMSRITFPGSLFLALVAIMPAFARLLHINSQFAQFFGGTSLLIMVGVILDTLQQIESHLLMRHYDGLMKTGRIKGRSSLSGAMR